MVCNIYKRKLEIYLQYLSKINNIKFTTREVEIIACVLNHNNNKKIASILLISNRTVETHILSISKKINCSSREFFSDFIEAANLSRLFNEYYNYVLIEAFFYKQLKYIKRLLSYQQFTCFLCHTEIDENNQHVLRQLMKDLKEVNVLVKDVRQVKPEIHKPEYFLILSDNYKDIASPANITSAAESNVIDFNKQNYYLNTFQLLEKITSLPQLKEIGQEFAAKCSEILKNLDPQTVNGEQNQKITSEKPLKNSINRHNFRVKLLIALPVFGLLVFFAAITYPPLNLAFLKPDDQNRFEVLLSELKNIPLSTDYTTPEQVQKNYNRIKTVENIISLSLTQDFTKYLTGTAVSATDLVQYLYKLFALANYYAYNSHDAKKAEEILIYAKHLAEEYVTQFSTLKLNFEELPIEDVYAELKIIQDLPEVYARIIYSLGRVYLYTKNGAKSLKYLEQAKYLGNQLGLFEGYLSDRSGLGIIKFNEIEKTIRQEISEQQRQHLQQLMTLYLQLKNCDAKYIVNYTPGLNSQQSLIPKEDIYNVVECSQQIIKILTTLIASTNSTEAKRHYLKQIENEFVDNNNKSGILKISEGLSNKKKASVYNSLGMLLLNLFNEQDDPTLQFFYDQIRKSLNLKQNTQLEIIEEIFLLAGSLSRNSDFTKADSYGGLAKLYRKKLTIKELPPHEKNRLIQLIDKLEKKQDDINRMINRN